MKLLLKFWHKTKDKIEDHLAEVIAFGIIGLLSIIAAFFWKWVKTTHSLEMPGWVWVLIVFGISTMPASIVFLIMRRKTKIRKEVFTDETDIKNALRQWFFQKYNSHWTSSGHRVAVNFDDLDQELGLVSGSTKKHIEDVINKLDHWQTRNKGLNTIEIFTTYIPQAGYVPTRPL